MMFLIILKELFRFLVLSFRFYQVWMLIKIKFIIRILQAFDDHYSPKYSIISFFSESFNTFSNNSLVFYKFLEDFACNSITKHFSEE